MYTKGAHFFFFINILPLGYHECLTYEIRYEFIISYQDQKEIVKLLNRRFFLDKSRILIIDRSP